jgi:two-component system chemotaxis sensor kinase CheA
MKLEIEQIDRNGSEQRIGEILTDRGDVGVDVVQAALAQQKPLGELLVGAGALSSDKLTSALAEQQHTRRDGVAAKPSASVRVPAERLDELMDRVGELVIVQSRLRQIAANSTEQQVKAVAEEVERLVLELRDTTMGIRMLPIGSLFGRFRRVVYDLSRELGKQVELVMEGEETELDKTVIEQLGDPLVHLIRNAIDHGLEDPAGRAAAGKPEIGRMTLSARHAGMEVLITITDDGRGLARDRIRARAEERGLLAPGAVLTDAELFQVLFQPGFSTAAQITSLSGRGVGMDVVKRTIEGLRGTIDLASSPGQGTGVTLRLPLTLAIIDGLLVRVGKGRYVLPLGAVEECVELSAEEDARSRGRSFLNIRGDLVPFLRLRDLFAAKTPPDRFQKIVVVSSGDLKVGLVVDQVIGDHQTVIKSLSRLHADIAMFSGATILGDGAVALILDVAHLVAYGQLKEEQLRVAG